MLYYTLLLIADVNTNRNFTVPIWAARQLRYIIYWRIFIVAQEIVNAYEQDLHVSYIWLMLS